jgi:aldehyde dehydrogenase (NAD+)
MICLSPIDGAVIGQVEAASPQEMEAAIERARQAMLQWSLVPAPKRGQLDSNVAEIVRRRKSELTAIITQEAGKIPSEAEGKVQE